MNKKISIISAILFGVGIIIVFGALIAIGFNFDKIVDITKENIEINQDFNIISIECDVTDVVIKPSVDGKCRMETQCARGLTIEYSVENGELKIKEERDWSRSLFGSPDNTLTLHLPKNEYQSLKLDGSTSDTKIESIDFEKAEIIASTADVVINSNIGRLTVEVKTGDVKINGMMTNSLSITVSTGDVIVVDTDVIENMAVSTSTGEVKLFEMSIGAGLSIQTSTGDVIMKSINAAHFKAKTSTGEIELDDVVLTGEMNLKTSSGDVELNRCDANTMIITTASGDVEGTLLTDKIFYVTTNSGDVIVPKSTQGGMCEVTTSSGDVELELINHKTKH